MRDNAPQTASKSDKLLAYAAWGFYLLSLIPILALAFYNFPSADDFNMGSHARLAFVDTGNFFAAWGQGLYMAWYDYLHWMGYYTSTALMSVPPNVFGEGFYTLGTFVLVFALSGTFTLFMHTLLVRTLGMNSARAHTVIALTLFFMVQALPAGMPRVETFYWYCSGANYILTTCIGLLYLSALLRLLDPELKRRGLMTVCACITGFLMGGGNMMTALTCSIIAFLLLFAKFIPPLGSPRDARLKTFLPAVLFLLAGFAASCLAPGNQVREGIVGGFGPVKSIVISLHYTAYYCFDQWLHTEHVLLLLFLAPLFWAEAPRAKCTFRHPLIAVCLAYGLASANVTPPIYALGQINAGRLQALFYMQFIVLLVLCEGYLIGWLRMEVLKLPLPAEGEKTLSGRYFLVLTGLFLVIAGLACLSDSDHYTGTEAAQLLADGSAAAYRAENTERIRILTDETVEDAVLSPHKSKPSLLYYADIEEDPNSWLNDGVARFYRKKSVRLSASAGPESGK